jgi:hypothetical protein
LVAWGFWTVGRVLRASLGDVLACGLIDRLPKKREEWRRKRKIWGALTRVQGKAFRIEKNCCKVGPAPYNLLFAPAAAHNCTEI